MVAIHQAGTKIEEESTLGLDDGTTSVLFKLPCRQGRKLSFLSAAGGKPSSIHLNTGLSQHSRKGSVRL